MAKSKKVCVQPKDCRVVAARLDFKAAKGCSARTAAAEAFRAAAAKRWRTSTAAERKSLFKEALRHVAGAYRSCGNEAAAQKVEEAARIAKIKAAQAPSAPTTEEKQRAAYQSSFEGLRMGKSRRRRSRR
jgi:hypothetical protein